MTYVITGETSDGFHTFNELYEFRLLYNAALFNAWAKAKKYKVRKSWNHADGQPCFGGGWFIVTAQLPTGQISNHYEAKDWKLFRVNVVKAAPEWDGHTAQDVAVRLRRLLVPRSTHYGATPVHSGLLPELDDDLDIPTSLKVNLERK